MCSWPDVPAASGLDASDASSGGTTAADNVRAAASLNPSAALAAAK